MFRLRWLALLGTLAWAGCSKTVTPDIMPEDDPTGDLRLQQMLYISNQEPARWSSAVTIPLSPVLLAADTSIKIVVATGEWVVGTLEWISSLLFGTSPPPRPDAVDRAADSLQHK